MNNKLICPFCQQELHKDSDGYYTCYTDNCGCWANGGNGASGSESLWLTLIDTKKKLAWAIRVIQEVSKMSDKLSRKYGDAPVEQLDTIQAFCWEQGYILTHDEDFKRVEQIKDKEEK